MAIDRATFLEIVKDAYSAYYTIFPVEEGQEELPLAFRVEYRSRDEKYFVIKSATIWGNEKVEYAYVFSAPSFSPELMDRCTDFALQEMLPKVKPHKEHQYTNCKVILLADSLDDETVKTVKKIKFSRSYGPLSTHGYSELLVAAVDVGKGRTWTNRAGYDLEKFFRKLFALRSEEAQSKGK